jgi:hypothetical protein
VLFLSKISCPVHGKLQVSTRHRNNGHQIFSICILKIQYKSTSPDAGCPDRVGPSSKFVDKPTKLPSLEIAGYLIKYSTVLWLLEIQISVGEGVRRGDIL